LEGISHPPNQSHLDLGTGGRGERGSTQWKKDTGSDAKRKCCRKLWGGGAKAVKKHVELWASCEDNVTGARAEDRISGIEAEEMETNGASD